MGTSLGLDGAGNMFQNWQAKKLDKKQAVASNCYLRMEPEIKDLIAKAISTFFREELSLPELVNRWEELQVRVGQLESRSQTFAQRGPGYPEGTPVPVPSAPPSQDKDRKGGNGHRSDFPGEMKGIKAFGGSDKWDDMTDRLQNMKQELARDRACAQPSTPNGRSCTRKEGEPQVPCSTLPSSSESARDRRLLGTPSENAPSVEEDGASVIWETSLMLSILFLVIYFVVRRFGFLRDCLPRPKAERTSEGERDLEAQWD